ncbi:YpjP family protein [Cytobacillus sp. IB215316]|uniref:YpjP family protein n=1 Tax=Cytobacillus sp. IB215316 TaxID=3097354 RepID=UPI0039B772F1
MPLWMRKTLVILITISTFGLISPPPSLTVPVSKSNDTSKQDLVNPDLTAEDDEHLFQLEVEEDEQNRQQFIETTMTAVEDKSFEKFGQKIGPVIEDEFRLAVLPKIEEVILDLTNQYPDYKLHNLSITESPSGGYGEKIFNIYDNEKNKDLVRFHVRRDHPPLEGYWFNFHYHTYLDTFQAHNDLGSIYWDKNTPPRWKT